MATQEVQEAQQAAVLASVTLTQSQVELLLVQGLMKEHQELSEILENQQVQLMSQWQTSKWSDPDALVSLFFVADSESSASADADEASDTAENQVSDEE